METVIVLLIVATILSLLIYYQVNEGKKAKALKQAAEDRTKKYIEEFQRVGDQFERTGIPTIQSDIPLKKSETLHAILSGTQWMEYRKVRTGRVAGHGITGRVRIAKGLSYRYGAGQMIAETIDSLKPIDSGDLYITNNGLYFRGRVGNKNLPFDKAMSIIPYPDGLKIERHSGKDIYMPYNFMPHPEKAAAIALLWDKSINGGQP